MPRKKHITTIKSICYKVSKVNSLVQRVYMSMNESKKWVKYVKPNEIKKILEIINDDEPAHVPARIKINR
jgi:hypothetical protein